MGTLTLKDIQEDARRGYIADKEKIARIMERVAEIPMGEMFDAVFDKDSREMGELLVGCLLEEREIQDGDIRSLPYAELACLLDQTELMNGRGVPFRNQGLFQLIQLFQKGRTNNLLLEQFSLIGVKELFDLLEDLGGYGEAYGLHRRFRKIMGEDGFSANMGIGKAIEKIRNRREVYLKPWWQPKDYERRLEEMYEVWTILLIDSFRLAYPKRFRLGDIVNKLRSVSKKRMTDL